MKKLLTVLLTVLIAFTTLTINVAASTEEVEVPEQEEIVETINEEGEKSSEEEIVEPVEEVEEELLTETVAEEAALETVESNETKTYKSVSSATVGKTYIIVDTNQTKQNANVLANNDGVATSIKVDVTKSGSNPAYITSDKLSSAEMVYTHIESGNYNVFKQDDYYLTSYYNADYRLKFDKSLSKDYQAITTGNGVKVKYDRSNYLIKLYNGNWVAGTSGGTNAVLYELVEMVEVSLDLNYDGAPEASKVSVEKGTKYNKLNLGDDPTRDGYLFLGWYTKATDGDPISDSSATVSGGETFYAHWVELNVYELVDSITTSGTYIIANSDAKRDDRDSDIKLMYFINDDDYAYGYDEKINKGTNKIDLASNIAGAFEMKFEDAGDGFYYMKTGSKYITAHKYYSVYYVYRTDAKGYFIKVNDAKLDMYSNKMSVASHVTYSYYNDWYVDENPGSAYLYKKVEKVKVTFNANGGTVDPTSKEFDVGVAYGELPTPTNGDKYFLGWFTAASGGDLVGAATLCDSNVTTLYAHWATKVKVPTAKDNLVYTGESQDGLNGYNEDYMEMAADVFNNYIKRTDAGTYYAHLDVKEGFIWDLQAGPSLETQTIEWTIAPMLIEASTPEEHTLTKEEKFYTPVITFTSGKTVVDLLTPGKDYSCAYFVGTVDDKTDEPVEIKIDKIVTPGEYTVCVYLNSTNFTFNKEKKAPVRLTKDGVPEHVYLYFELVDKTKVTPVLVNDPLIYNGKDQTKNLMIDCDGDKAEDKIAGIAYITAPGYFGEERVREVKNAGEYRAYLLLNNTDEYEWSDETRTTTDKKYAIVQFVVLKKEIDYRTEIKDLVKNDLVYDGDSHRPINERDLPIGVSYADTAAYFMGRDNYATNAGDYVAILAIDSDNCVWSKDTKIEKDFFGNEYAVVEWNIAKKDAKVTIAHDPVEYGLGTPEKGYTFTPDGFVNRDFNALDDYIKVFVEAGRDVGEYDIDGKLDIPGSFWYDDVRAIANNYNITFDGKLVITPATLYVSIAKEDLTFEYDAMPHTPKVNFEGFKYDDKLTDDNHIVVYNPGLLNNSIDVGTKYAYVGLLGDLAKNYEIDGATIIDLPLDIPSIKYKALTYEITPKTVYTHWENLEYVYDGNTHSPDLVFEGTYPRDGIGCIQIDIPANELPEDHDFNEDELMAKFDKAQKSNDAIIKFRDADTYYTFGLVAGRTSNYVFVGLDGDYDPWTNLISFTEFHIHPRKLKVVWSDKVKFSKKSYAQGPEILDLEVVNDEGDAIVDWDIDIFGENIVYVDYAKDHGKQTKVGKYTAVAEVYSTLPILHPTTNYKLVNDTIDFKIYRKSNEDTTPVKTGVER